jgi:hypothetical protein
MTLTQLRTREKFSGFPPGRRHDSGRLTWEPKAVEGYEFRVWESLASVSTGDSALMACADAFGTLVRRLVEDGAEVRPDRRGPLPRPNARRVRGGGEPAQRGRGPHLPARARAPAARGLERVSAQAVVIFRGQSGG